MILYLIRFDTHNVSTQSQQENLCLIQCTPRLTRVINELRSAAEHITYISLSSGLRHNVQCLSSTRPLHAPSKPLGRLVPNRNCLSAIPLICYIYYIIGILIRVCSNTRYAWSRCYVLQIEASK